MKLALKKQVRSGSKFVEHKQLKNK